MAERADFVIRNADLLVTCAGPAPRRGAAQRDIRAIPGGAVAGAGGIITFTGSTDECDRAVTPAANATVLDASGCTVIPGLVDPHTHAIFGGDRIAELRERLAGATYAQLAAAGGGILSTVRATRLAEDEELLAQAETRLAGMLRSGTTTCEIKSGYGLDLPTEARLLRLVRQLAASQPVDVVPTFLGAHAVPAEYASDRGGYVNLVVNEMIPAVAAGGLAEWCDVFCDRGAFTPAESRAVLEAGRRAGLKPRIHADELATSGGSLVAAEVGARSADHLICIDARGIEALASAGVVATLAPSAALFLKLGRFAPARALIAAGVPVALATDVNPGGGLSSSMPLAMMLGCFAMDMTFEEALVAATINAAYAIDRHERAGSLEPGKLMDAVIVAGDALNLVGRGAEAIRAVIKRGTIVAERS